MMNENDEQETHRTYLYDSQKELGASFSHFFGWEMAESFNDPKDECRAVRESVGVVDLSYGGAIKIGGSESIQFLNGLVTNDVKVLSKGKGMSAAFLTGHGKVKALCRVLGLGEEEYLILNNPQTHEKVYSQVFPFSFAGDFKVEDCSDQYRIISIQGSRSLLVMKEICFEPVPSLAENDWIETIIAGHHVVVIRASHTGEDGYDILVPTEGLKDVWDFILLKGDFHSIVPFGQRALDLLRVEAGIPVYGIDVDESNMMLETGLSEAVSYTKGCYTGQEAVAMATYRGHISKKLTGLTAQGETLPSSGNKVLKDGKTIGYITSAIHSYTMEATIALAYIKYGFFDPGNIVEILSSDENISATVVDIPFYRAV